MPESALPRRSLDRILVAVTSRISVFSLGLPVIPFQIRRTYQKILPSPNSPGSLHIALAIGVLTAIEYLLLIAADRSQQGVIYLFDVFFSAPTVSIWLLLRLLMAFLSDAIAWRPDETATTPITGGTAHGGVFFFSAGAALSSPTFIQRIEVFHLPGLLCLHLYLLFFLFLS